MNTKNAIQSRFPVHDALDVIDGVTIFKNANWWKAVLLYEGFSGREIGIYLWKRGDDGWKRKQKYVIRSKDDWIDDRKVIKEFLEELSENSRNE